MIAVLLYLGICLIGVPVCASFGERTSKNASATPGRGQGRGEHLARLGSDSSPEPNPASRSSVSRCGVPPSGASSANRVRLTGLRQSLK